MTGKVVPLRPRTGSAKQDGTGEAWNRIVNYIQPQFSEVEIHLKQAASRTPDIIRQSLLDLLDTGERFCPALFLSITKGCETDRIKMAQFAASLEALDLALRVHRSMNRKHLHDTGCPFTTDILAGDFYFSLALTLAGEAPVIIKGMAEIISRVVSSELENLEGIADISGWRKAHLKRLSDGYASIMALSATLAGWCGKMEAWQNESLAFFGHYVGMGLQLRREQVIYQANKSENVLIGDLTLPIIYVLEHSSRRRELISLLNRSEGLNLKDEIFVREYEKNNPEVYINQITGNCICKARECLEVLQRSLSADTEAALNSFVQVHELV